MTLNPGVALLAATASRPSPWVSGGWCANWVAWASVARATSTTAESFSEPTILAGMRT